MRRVLRILGEIVLLAACAIYLFPVYLVFVNSFKNRQELYENMVALPGKFTKEYYVTAMEKMNFLKAFSNSLIVTIISITIIIILASMTAWMLVRTNNKLSKTLFMVFVATMLIPFQTIMMPLMQVMGWIRTNLHIPT